MLTTISEEFLATNENKSRHIKYILQLLYCEHSFTNKSEPNVVFRFIWSDYVLFQLVLHIDTFD